MRFKINNYDFLIFYQFLRVSSYEKYNIQKLFLYNVIFVSFRLFFEEIDVNRTQRPCSYYYSLQSFLQIRTCITLIGFYSLCSWLTLTHIFFSFSVKASIQQVVICVLKAPILNNKLYKNIIMVGSYSKRQLRIIKTTPSVNSY